MKLNEILRRWRGDRRYTAIAVRGAALRKEGLRDEALVAALDREFGAPPELARLRDEAQPMEVFGAEVIEHGAFEQMRLALRLPIAVRGALMPDAHPGFALPIGGVFAAHRAISPMMVGVDIACRMRLSLFAEPPEELLRNRSALFADLQAVTYFGAGRSHPRPPDHAVIADERWELTRQLRDLRGKAAVQLGTSGSGNHFAELVVGEVLDRDGLPEGTPERFWGLITHSGSRGVGASIADRYAKLAAEETKIHASVPKMYEWLSLDDEPGQEYWQAMELAGAFAAACHEVIHRAFARRAKLTVAASVENHHNFAWREGDLVIHRKGATPAGHGELGIIPGSMASASYLVAGGGVEAALNSAAHGAGRASSRRAAREQISPRAVEQLLAQRDVLVAGLSIDESPQAYKDIEQVMAIQVAAGLIRPLARMTPVAVIMAGEKGND